VRAVLVAAAAKTGAPWLDVQSVLPSFTAAVRSVGFDPSAAAQLRELGEARAATALDVAKTSSDLEPARKTCSLQVDLGVGNGNVCNAVLQRYAALAAAEDRARIAEQAKEEAAAKAAAAREEAAAAREEAAQAAKDARCEQLRKALDRCSTACESMFAFNGESAQDDRMLACQDNCTNQISLAPCSE
jgi:LPS O-antigen subunit length determinant protein (WzzB/FepE family)